MASFPVGDGVWGRCAGPGGNDMSDELSRTIKIKRDRKIGTDSQGHSVWTKPVEETEFELVSTVMLKQIIESDDHPKKEQLRALADEEDGVLACATGSDEFEILPDDELEAALQAANNPESPNTPRQVTLERVGEPDDEEELSLVSTQMLRKVLAIDDESDAAPEEEGGGGGYNPYDRG